MAETMLEHKLHLLETNGEVSVHEMQYLVDLMTYHDALKILYVIRPMDMYSVVEGKYFRCWIFALKE